MGTYVQPTNHTPNPNSKTPTPKPNPKTPNPRPHQKPCVKKILIYGHCMSVGLNEIYYGYLHVKSGFVWLTMLRSRRSFTS